MASHKTLKSVATSLAQSFTSLMNYSGDDYVTGHLVYAAWQTGGTECRVDLGGDPVRTKKSPEKVLDSRFRGNDRMDGYFN